MQLLQCVTLAQEPNARTLSMFLDEVSSAEYLHQEDFYGLEENQTYEFSFSLRKEPGVNAGRAHVGVLTKISKEGSKSGENHFLVHELGSDIPADGQWHTVEGTFKTKAPTGSVFVRNPNDAFRASLILYNKGSNGDGKVFIRDFKGAPKYPDFAYLGEKDPTLPRILLIGDSTMMHTYGEKVKAFADRASIYYIPVNAMHTDTSITKYRRWVGEKEWDLIYFNSGIHDLTAPKGDLTGSAPNRVPLDRYEENLRLISAFLKSTGTKLVWRSITPIAPGIKSRSPGDVERYNNRAAKLMRELEIPVHDVTMTRGNELLSHSRDGVHFNQEGNQLLAKEFLEFLSKHSLPGAALESIDNGNR